MNSSSTFRRLRRATFKRLLVPQGFIDYGSIYVRHHSSGQVHCIEFAAMKYGGGFTVDLGVHFEGVPPFEMPAQGSKAPLTAEACCIRRRLRKPDNDQFFAYGESEHEATLLAERLAEQAEAILLPLADRWGGGMALANEVSPEHLVHDLEVFEAGLEATTVEDQHRVFSAMRIRQLLPDWHPHVGPVALALCFVCQREGNVEQAKAYGRLATRLGQGFFLEAFL